MRKLLMASVMLGALAMPAKAVTVLATDIGASGTTAINGVVEPFGVITGLTGTLYLEYTGLTNGGLTWNFDYTVTNTSTNIDSRISGFGLNTTPNPVSGASTGLFNTVQVGSQAGFLGTVDFCATAGSTCGGGGGGGLLPGQTASGDFDLTFSVLLSQLILDGAFLRYQSINGSVFDIIGGSGFGINTGVNINPLVSPVPIPGALVLFLSGLFGLGGLQWLRGRSTKQPMPA